MGVENSFTRQSKNTKSKYEKKIKLLPMIVLKNVKSSHNIHKATRAPHKNKKNS